MHCDACGTDNLGNPALCNACGSPLAGPAPTPVDPAVEYSGTSGLAVAGFVLAFFCGLLGLLLSIMGYSEVKRSEGRLSGEGLAAAGIVISIVNMLIGLMVVLSR